MKIGAAHLVGGVAVLAAGILIYRNASAAPATGKPAAPVSKGGIIKFGPTKVTPVASSDISYKNQGPDLDGTTDYDSIVNSSGALDVTGQPVLGIDDPNAIPVF